MLVGHFAIVQALKHCSFSFYYNLRSSIEAALDTLVAEKHLYDIKESNLLTNRALFRLKKKTTTRTNGVCLVLHK